MKKEIIKNIDLFLFDMDGTLYLGNRIFPYTVKLLNKLKEAGKKYLFLTNNSSKNKYAYVEKLKSLGIKADINDFLTSTEATCHYLKKQNITVPIYVCGTDSLKEELKNNGFVIADNFNNAECVLIGYDTELNYKKLWDVCEILTKKDVPYIATNPDYVCPTEFGSVPDCGSICDMIFNATKKRPIFIGKPSPLMIDLAVEKMGVSKQHTAVIGDRIYTDVKSGLNADVTSILVMSGETTEEILKNSADKPTIVLKDAGEILNYI